MNRYLVLVTLGALALPGSAQTQSDIDAVRVSGYRGTPATSNYRMWQEDFKPFKGAYDLSNGMTLYVSGSGKRMFAQVDDQTMHEIVATGPDRFAALDQKLSMRIDLRDSDNVRGELSFVNEAAGPIAVGGTSQPTWVHLAFR